MQSKSTFTIQNIIREVFLHMSTDQNQSIDLFMQDLYKVNKKYDWQKVPMSKQNVVQWKIIFPQSNKFSLYRFTHFLQDCQYVTLQKIKNKKISDSIFKKILIFKFNFLPLECCNLRYLLSPFSACFPWWMKGLLQRLPLNSMFHCRTFRHPFLWEIFFKNCPKINKE